MTITKNKQLLLLLFLALLIRLGVSYFQFSGDVKNHLIWGNGFLAQPIGFYSHHFLGFNDPNYPSITIFLFAASNFLYNFFNNLVLYLNKNWTLFPSFVVPVVQSENMKMAFLKLPAIISDVLIGYYLYKFSLQQNRPKALLITSLYLFNPAVIYVSSVWGQIESVTLLFLLVSIIAAYQGSLFSVIFFTVSALTKQTALWFLPFFIFLWFFKISIKNFKKGILYSGMLLFVSYLPFGLNPVSVIKNYLSTLSGSSEVVSDAAWNFWYFLYPQGTNDSTLIGFLSVRQVSITILILCLFYFLYGLVKKYRDDKFFLYLFIWSLLVFFVQTRVHERHLAPALLFCLLVPGLYERVFIDYLLLSAYHMYNLYSILKLPFV